MRSIFDVVFGVYYFVPINCARVCAQLIIKHIYLSLIKFELYIEYNIDV